MGGALLAGWRERRGIAPHFHVVEPAPGPAFPDVTRHAGPESLPAGLAPAAIVLAVKPQSLDAVLPPYRRLCPRRRAVPVDRGGQDAGLFPSASLGPARRSCDRCRNTPAAIGRGIAVACASAAVDAAQRDLADRLLAAVGEVEWVADEGLLDAVTAVSGSGPAYVFLLIECLAKAGVEAGLPDALALQLARATVAGSERAGAAVIRAGGDLARERDEPRRHDPGGARRADGARQSSRNADDQQAVAAATQRRSRELAD